MLRCPVCYWINLDSDYHCRRCGHFLRRPSSFAKRSLLQPNRGRQNRKKAKQLIRWDRVLTLTAILGTLLGLGQISWHWVEPLLQEPPPPNFGVNPEVLRRSDDEPTRTFENELTNF
ncbi:MAG: hypothetical protein Q6K80_05995 [Thermostichus sp. DG_1_6_bins_120]